MNKPKVAIQGIAGSFHEVAARKYFNHDIQIVECNTFKTLSEKIDDESVDFGVMAIENTLAGSILPNYTLLRSFHSKIVGEVYLRIHMTLMALPGTSIAGLKEVHSHPMAIRQCREYLNEHPHIYIVEKNDTAEAAKDIRDHKLKDTAAIASATAAEIYNLQVLDHGIETNKRNFTRFLILSKDSTEDVTNNKASICFELGHQVGALANILNIFTKYEINLTKIQSIPIVGKPYEYDFHLDLEWQKWDNYERAIHAVLKNVSNLSILGEYKKGEYDLNGKNNKQDFVAC